MDYNNGKKQELCIAAYVYGYKYQGWIPVYLYSILKNYPQYHVRIYLDGKLSLSVKRSLALLSEYKENFEIIEHHYLKKARLSNLENRSLRWVLCDNELKKYKYVYVGDIDIYICKEKEDLLTQHKNHMHLTGLPYSNVLRLKTREYLNDKKGNSKRHLFRLTGLHFFKTDAYFNATQKCRDKISDLLLGSPCKFHFIKRAESYLLKKYVTTDDERTLFFIVLCSHLGFPDCSYELNENTAICFRPLHGIHFAIGREPSAYGRILATDNAAGIAKRNEFEGYFESFVSDYNSSKTLRKLFMNNHYVSEILLETCRFFGYKLCAEEIVKGEG